MQNEKIGFFQKMLISIKDFEKYILFASEKISDTFKFFLKIMLIFSLIVSIGLTISFYNIMQECIKYYYNNIESIEYANCELEVNNGEKIVIENENAIIQYIEINTQMNEKDYTESKKENLYTSGVILLKDKVIIKIQNEDIQALTYKYEEILDQHGINYFNKEHITNLISKINNIQIYFGVFASIYVYMFLVYTISNFFDILLLTIVGYIVGRIAKVKLKLKSAFSIGVHALTLPIILNIIYILINVLTGFTIKYFGWMYTTISHIYVVVAILMIKTDIIHTQIELAKIIKEQENIKQELKEKDRENEKEKKDKEEKKDTDSQEDDKLDSSEA